MSITAPDDLAARVYHIARVEGDFVLRSGVSSREYFDKYRFESNPAILRDVAERMQQRLPPDIDVLAGLELGGIPLATALSLATGLPAAFVRKQPKSYGTRQFAEGTEIRGRRLLVVEDVVTSGGQVVESVGVLRTAGATITDAMCVIDREAGGRETLEKIGVRLTSLFTLSALRRAAGDGVVST